jgi:curved DNA-binding protein CbpA
MLYYKALGFDAIENDTKNIKKAYYKLAKIHHPDKEGGKPEDFKRIQTAYEILMKPEDKAVYDEAIKAGWKHTEEFYYNLDRGLPKNNYSSSYSSKPTRTERSSNSSGATPNNPSPPPKVRPENFKEWFEKNVRLIRNKAFHTNMFQYNFLFFNQTQRLSDYYVDASDNINDIERGKTTGLIKIIEAIKEASEKQNEAIAKTMLTPFLVELRRLRDKNENIADFINYRDEKGNTALLLLTQVDQAISKPYINHLIELGADPTLDKSTQDAISKMDNNIVFNHVLQKCDEVKANSALNEVRAIIKDYAENHLKISLSHPPLPSSEKKGERTKANCIYDCWKILSESEEPEIEISDEEDNQMNSTSVKPANQKLIRLHAQLEQDRSILIKKENGTVSTFFGRIAEIFSNLFKSPEEKKYSTAGLSKCGLFASHGERTATLASEAIQSCIPLPNVA